LDTIPTVFPCRYEHLHFDQGIVHLDGTNALKFVRSRHAADNSGDFGRSSRQRNLVSALKKKMFSPFIIPKIIPLYNSLHNHVFTDISLDEMKTLFLSASDLGKYSVKSIPMTDQTLFNFGFSSDRQYILIPKSGEDDWNEVHDWISKEIIRAIHTETPIAK
jgi:anionic cell wall polymer biosynthesis LytR-Cps2A-Psr (LCP) family protein